MGSPAEAEPTPRPELSPLRDGVGPGPVAVVWCRQVDNEAESPGYTSVPEEFPGRRETLDLIRLVGNLTVNVADTHDYWTPGPPQALAYYPNLFLYPAYGGRYTCVGRMFLSTEDRPRLGMKTLVLDTAQLLASGEFGAGILRWYATMAGGRGEGRRPPVPDPALYPLVGEGFLFHRGATEPVVLVASTEWDATMAVILELVRQLPASLVMLGAILAFPYFLPQAKTNLHEFAEQVPLALSLMRIPPSEAVGDRHRKRLQSWESTPFTFRDLTAGLPVPARGKENVPTVLQYVRDHNAARLGPIVQRVDLVELPKLRGLLADPERQSGKERRKEMWRIGTAMESAALLLQRSRGRHVPVSVESAKRAQEYLRAELPSPGEEAAPTAATGAAATEAASGGHPSWLSKAGDLPARTGPEVVPVSSSEDPSIQVAPAPPSMPSGLPPLSGPALEREIEAAMGRVLGPRLHQLEEEVVRRLAAEVQQAVGDEVERHIDQVAESKFRTLIQSTESQLAQALTSLDTRWQEKFRELGGTASEPSESLRGQFDAQLASARTDQARALAQATAGLEARLTQLDARMNEQLTGLLAATERRLRESLPVTLSTEIDRRLRAAIERELADSPRGERGAIAGRIDARIDSAVRLAAQGAVDQLGRSVRELEQRWEERLRAAQSLNAPLGAKALESLEPVLTRKVGEAIERERSALTKLREELARGETAEREALAHELERRISEAVGTEAEARGESEERQRQWMASVLAESAPARQKELRDLEGRLSALIDARTKDGPGRLATNTREIETRVRSAMEERAGQIETRVAKTLEGRFAEAREQQAHADADVQVRLQSYTDQKIREAEERLRGTTVELLARLRSDVEGSLGRLPDVQRLESAYKDRLQRTTEALRSELQLVIDHRLTESEDRLRQRAAEAVQRLEGLERELKDQTGGLAKIEGALRTELDDLDRRIVTLSDRLLPVVRKTWLRVAELEKAPGGGVDAGTALAQLRREFKEELRRVDVEIGERIRDIRDRMETTIAHQGKVWLTVIRQLSQLTEDRRAAPRPPFPPLAAGPLSSVDEEEAEEGEEDQPEEEPPARRRLRRSGRGPIRS